LAAVAGASVLLSAHATLGGAQAQVQLTVKNRLSTPELAKKASASMVTITTPGGLGSGVIVDAAGVIVTNLHVVRGQKQASVKLANGDIYDVTGVVDVDERKDLVLLRVKAFGLTPATFGNSDLVLVGDRVTLIASPRGLDLSVSDGLLSAVRDSGEGYRLFQTSAAASPGSSGGGMFNEFGELIGIVSSKLTNGENINFGIPVNYVRGLIATESRMTLADLAAKFPALTGITGSAAAGTPAGPTSSTTAVTASGTTGGAAPTGPSPAALSRMAALLAASTLEWTKNGETNWSTSYKGKSLPMVTVSVSLIGDLVVCQSVAATAPKLSVEQMAALLKFNFTVNLVKVSWPENNKGEKVLLVLNETEIRLLDSAGLKRIVDTVALNTDTLAGWLAPPPAAASAPPPPPTPPTPPTGVSTVIMLMGHAVLHYKTAQWKSRESGDPSTYAFDYAGGDLYTRIFTGRIQVPLENMPGIALAQMQKQAPDAKIVRQTARTVNGTHLLAVEIEATAGGIPLTYYDHYYSDSAGTVEIDCWTGRNLIAGSRATIEDFVSGFFIAKTGGGIGARDRAAFQP
jgi:S1-C subfamily serine protease